MLLYEMSVAKLTSFGGNQVHTEYCHQYSTVGKIAQYQTEQIPFHIVIFLSKPKLHIYLIHEDSITIQSRDGHKYQDTDQSAAGLGHVINFNTRLLHEIFTFLGPQRFL